ncbi:translesion DNA synthesis-associated protein ImuA [Thalassotalea litorea]|uniref:Translesion DNA synthesis-associated protein ImuA n=1 Tax=Thalassotalea litorea TaxID=2020715 RepID=A0A5R9INK6_9GAMM|nr:translesion DNA synthesis-associated protein ImuA [Thalassotalea litorea]TLU64816.1 translesion DNA synthesis-associated protein ImuA [Thalassotalea litorea]
MNKLIKDLQHRHLVWHGAVKTPEPELESSGYSELDQHLNGGLIKAGAIEILTETGIGELRLLLPTLTADPDRLLIFINPPGHVNATMLAAQKVDLQHVVIITPEQEKDALWSTEECLKSGACGSVLLWLDQAIEIHQVKRLQLAAEKGASRVFMLRQKRYETLSLPLDLSLSLSASPAGVDAQINKRKRGWPSKAFHIDMQRHWPSLTLGEIPDNLIYFPASKAG